MIQTKFENNETHQKHKKILDSQLLSGGLELRHINELSEDSKKLIISMVEMLQDHADDLNKSEEDSKAEMPQGHELVNALNRQETHEHDKYLQAILNIGQIADIDTTIELLHWNFERNIDEKAVEEFTPDEITAMRGVFASAIKLSDLVENFVQISEFVGEVKDDTKTGNEKYEALLSDVKNMPNFRKINKMWAYSSGIKTWYSEQTKKIDEEYKKKAEEKKKKEKEDKENESKQEDSKEEQKEEDSKNENEETIDTTKGGNDDKGDSNSKSTLDNKLMKNMQSDKDKLLKGFMEKAELLTKF